MHHKAILTIFFCLFRFGDGILDSSNREDTWENNSISISDYLIERYSQDYSDSSFTIPQYIDEFKCIAVYEMERNGIPASIIMAQAILESSYGNSLLCKQSNNHFGIKAYGWKGKYVRADDDLKAEKFRSYETVYESFRDHSDMIKAMKRYSGLFAYGKDYTKWAYGLKYCGYATDRYYARRLLYLINRYDLQNLDTASTSNMLITTTYYGRAIVQ